MLVEDVVEMVARGGDPGRSVSLYLGEVMGEQPRETQQGKRLQLGGSGAAKKREADARYTREGGPTQQWSARPAYPKAVPERAKRPAPAQKAAKPNIVRRAPLTSLRTPDAPPPASIMSKLSGLFSRKK